MSEKGGGAQPARNMSFACVVRPRDMQGQSKTIILEAPSKEDAVQRLLNQGYMVVSVSTSGKKIPGIMNIFSVSVSKKNQSIFKFSLPMFQGVSEREVIFFAVQASTLLKAGVPLLRSLDIIHKGISNHAFKSVIQSIKKKIAGGATLNAAIRDHPKVFPWVWANMVEVGEATGKLPQCLDEIAVYQEAAARIKTKVITAFTYPAILMTAVIGALTFLMIAVIPKFEEIFIQQNLKLPVITQIVIGISNIVRHHFLIVILIVVVAVIAFLHFRKTPKVCIFFDTIALGFPVFGIIFLQVAVVRFSRSLCTLLRSGVPILKALEISGRLVNNSFIELKIKQVAEAIKNGQMLGAQLESKKMFPVFMTQLISVGEESGELERFLDLIAKYYEDGVDTFLTRLTTLLEPIMLVFMGGVIGTIVISLFLPIVTLSTGGG